MMMQEELITHTVVESVFPGDALAVFTFTEPVQIKPLGFVMSLLGSNLEECRLTFEVDTENYRRIDHENLFNMQPERRSPSALATFYKDRPVKVEARLSFDLVADLQEFCPDLTQVGQFFYRINGINQLNPFMESESWFGLYVYQEIDGQRLGYSTEWAGFEPVPALPLPAEAFNIIVAYFEEEEWNIAGTAGGPTLMLNYRGDNDDWQCYATFDENDNFVSFYSEAPLVVPSEKRLAVAELLTRINFGLVVGNFEMDFDSGLVRYKTALDLNEVELEYGLLRGLVEPNVTLTDYYLPALKLVVEQNLPPLEAIQQVEREDVDDI